MSKKAKKINVKAKKTKSEPKKEKEKPKKEAEYVSKVDINTQVYRDLFKFLEEKVSLECLPLAHVSQNANLSKRTKNRRRPIPPA